MPVSGAAHDAADDQEDLQAQRDREPCRQQLREAVAGEARRLQPALDHEQVHEQQRRRLRGRSRCAIAA